MNHGVVYDCESSKKGREEPAPVTPSRQVEVDMAVYLLHNSS
jgi:hypothetical protein